MSKDNNHSLDLLFKPKNIAIYTASEKLYYFIMGFKEHEYDLNNLYLVSPNNDELFGIKCIKSIEDIPSDTIDLCIIAVRRDILVKSLREVLSKKKVKFIHFFSAGAGESDEIGVKIGRELRDILDKNENKVRAIGPNCMGLYCPEGKNTYTPTFPREPGHIGLIFHSGDLHSKMIIYSNFRHNMTFSKGVSVVGGVSCMVMFALSVVPYAMPSYGVMVQFHWSALVVLPDPKYVLACVLFVTVMLPESCGCRVLFKYHV